MYVLNDLFSGNIHPNEWYHRKGDAYSHALDKVVAEEEQLLPLLDETSKERFKRYQMKQAEVMSMDNFRAFKTGFQLGARLILDVLESE